MANVVRFTLPTARDVNVHGAGFFKAGVLDVDANDLHLIARTRYLVRPYGAIEIGIVDSATPAPSLPAVPVTPPADPYPQYVTDTDLTNPSSSPMVAVKAAFDAWGPTSGLGIPGLLLPATSATTDRLADIQAAFTTRDTVILLGGTFAIYDRLILDSNKKLVVWNAELVRYPDGRSAATSNSHIVTNRFCATGTGSPDTDIAVTGIGRAVLRLNDATAHPRNTGSLRMNFGMAWLNAQRIRVSGIKLGPTQAFAANFQVCTDVLYTNIDLAQDVSTVNQDGLDIGPGCSNIVFRGITGKTGDDLFSIYAQNTSASLWPYTKTLTAAERNISQVTVSDVVVDAGINFFRLQAGDGSSLSGLTATNLTNTHVGATTTGSPQCLVQFGASSYVTTLGTNADLSNIRISGVRGAFAYLLALDSKGSNIHVSDVQLGGFTRLVGYTASNNQAGFVPDFTDITLDGITSTSLTTSGVILALAAGTIARIALRNMTLGRVGGILANGATVTGLILEGIKVAIAGGSAPFRSTVAETGRMSNVTIDTVGGGLKHYDGAPLQLVLAGDVPELIVGDVVPYAARGSMLRAKAGIDPTGGAFAQGAVYVGDGTAWNRIVALTNDGGSPPAAVPGQVTGLAAGTATASTQPLTWTATSGATAYTVEYKLTSGSTWTQATTSATGASYTVTGLTSGTSYDYRVSASNSSGTGTSSAIVTASTTAVDTTAPTVPTGLTATPGVGQVSLSWTASTDAVGVTGYKVRRGGTLVASPTSTSYVNSGLTGGTTYSFTVSAVDAAGNESAQTSAVTATPTGGAPTAFVSDTFTGADSTTLTAHTGETGATWTKVSGTGSISITGNRARTIDTNAAVYLASGTPGSADYAVEADFYFATVPTNMNAGIVLRGAGAGNGYAARYVGASAIWRLDKLTSGTGTSLGSAAVSQAVGSTAHVKIRAAGTSIIVSVDGVDIITVTDATYTAAGTAGLIMNGAMTATVGVHIDNLVAA